MKTIKHLLTIIALGLLTFTASAQSWLTNGLVAYYPFNGDSNDSSGNGWKGTPRASSGVTVSANYVGGNLGGSSQAINLSGGAFVDLGLSISPSVPDGLTQVFWVKSTQQIVTALGGDGPITRTIVFLTRRTSMATYGNDYVGGWPTMCINGEGNLAIDVDDDFYGNENQITNIPSSRVLDGKWHQVVGIKNGTSYSLFFDGTFVNQFTDAHQLSDSDGKRHIWLGRHYWSYAGPLDASDCNATLSGVRIYNRALSTNEVAQLYAIESAPADAQTWTWSQLQTSNNVPANFQAGRGAVDYAHGLVYSAQQISGQAGSLMVYNMASNTFTTLPSAGWPGEIRGDSYVYDATNNRILGWQDGRTTVYAIPATGGTWQSLGGGGQSSTDYGNNKWWNPVSGKISFFDVCNG